MPKELVVLGVYVDDAAASARGYASRLAMREIAAHSVRTESAQTDCIVMAGSDKPPWLVLFSGTGDESVAARMRAERPAGLHQLVYFTDAYASDLQWLRRRGLGFERLVPLDGTKVLRRLSASIAELGVVIDLIERPPLELDEWQWLRPLVDALMQPSLARPTLPKRHAISPRKVSLNPSASALTLAAGESLSDWLARVEEHPWSAACDALRGDGLRAELRAIVEGISERGPRAFGADLAAAADVMRQG